MRTQWFLYYPAPDHHSQLIPASGLQWVRMFMLRWDRNLRAQEAPARDGAADG